MDPLSGHDRRIPGRIGPASLGTFRPGRTFPETSGQFPGTRDVETEIPLRERHRDLHPAGFGVIPDRIGESGDRFPFILGDHAGRIFAGG